MRRLSIAITLFLLTARGFSGGFQVALQGQKQSGMGQSGACLAFDASALYFNPGSLCMLDKSSFVVGANFISGKINYSGLPFTSYSAKNEPELGTPFAAYFHLKAGKKISAGIGAYTPFGSTVRYADDWKGQFLIRELSLKTIFIQPTFSFKINEKLGIGAGFVFATGSVSLRKGIPVLDSLNQYGEATLSGSGNGFGWNAGIHFHPNDNWTFGITFRSKVAFNADGGNATFVVPNSLTEYFPATTFSSKIVLPFTSAISAAYKGVEKWTFALDFNFTGWSSYDTLSFDFKDNTDKLTDSHSPREYKNAFTIRGGAQYEASEMLTLRAGAYFDRTPVMNGYITPETPDANKVGLTGGASFKIGKGFSADVSALFVASGKREVENTEAGFAGTFKTKAFIGGIGIQYIFP